ncbi:MAG: DMT family transporter [Simkaniaceae bacterium]|nr:DMT family transporter [Simkaniaceae bacterium]
MGAVILSVYGWVLLRMVVKNDEVPPTTANGLSMLIGGAMALGHSFLFEAWNPLPIVAGGIGPVIKGTVILTLLSNVICYNLYGHLLKRFTATLMSFFGLLSPIFASLTGWLILGEPPSLTIMLSTCIVLIGLYFVYRSELKQGYIYSSTPIDA